MCYGTNYLKEDKVREIVAKAEAERKAKENAQKIKTEQEKEMGA